VQKNITFILGKMAGGGAERVVSYLTDYYASKEQYSVKVIVLLSNRIDYKLPENVELVYLSAEGRKGFLRPFIWFHKLRKEIKENKQNIIISFFAKINLLVLIASFGIKASIYISERNDPRRDNRGSLIKFLTFILYPFSKGVIFQTKHAKRCFPKWVQNKSVIIPNPVNIDFNFSKRKSLNKTIVAVGKLMEQKNHELLINAFAAITEDYPDYKLEIYGEGKLRNHLNKLIIEKKLNDRVYLKGRTTDVFNIVYNANLFVLSSNYEGMSNALLEAMMLETPVISTNCAGSDELVVNGETGKIVDINDCNQLANAIAESLNHYPKAEKMAQNAKRQVERFTLEKICNRWNSFIHLSD